MTQEQEQSLIDLQRHSATLDSRLTTLETNFAVFVQEMKDFKQSIKESNDNLKAEMQDFKQEMRQQNEMRAAENEEIRQSIREIYQTTDAKIAEIRNSIDSMGKNVRNVSYTAIAAIGAMVVTVLMNLPK